MTTLSVKKQITVETSQQRAFRTFTEGMDRWWPREHHAAPSPLRQVVLEQRAGGRWYSICQDGSEAETGKVIAWEPPDRLVLSWQLDGQWRYDPTFSTELEVRFVAEGPRRTRVELEHRNLERYGADADRMAKTLDEPGAWQLLLDRYGTTTVGVKYVMIYDSTPAGLAKAPQHLPAHRERLDLFRGRGTLLMAGPLMDPATPGRALGIFTSREAADEFIAGDPFIVHGVVDRYTVTEWREVLY